MSDQSIALTLPARPGIADLAALRETLLCHSDQPVAISASDWQRFDSLTLQFLISVHADWQRRGLRLVLRGVSVELASIFRRIGLTLDMLTWEEAK